MSAAFDRVFERLIGHEGGYANDGRDPGGETKYGISKRAYPDEDIRNLTLARAKVLYRRDYWDRLSLDSLPESVAGAVMDTAVNSGVGTAARLLQRSLGVAEDGVIGPVTRRAMVAVEPARLAVIFLSHRLDFLCTLTTFTTFGRGWTRRVAAELRTVLR